MSYNGYTNYETWNVNLWIYNDENVYRFFQGMNIKTIDDYKKAVKYCFPDGTPDFNNESDYDKVNWQESFDSWKER